MKDLFEEEEEEEHNGTKVRRETKEERKERLNTAFCRMKLKHSNNNNQINESAGSV